MKRWIHSPRLSFTLLIIWLLLNQSLALADILLGSVLALVVPMLLRPLTPFDVRMRKPRVIVHLIMGSMVEILRSCINVSQLILFTSKDKLNSQFITVPLELRSPYGLAALSCIINCTPGTVWVELLPETHELALHVFDLHDEQWWVETIKTRYEQPLIEIFEGEDGA